MKVFCKEFITVWTRGLVRWLSRKFDSISIDFTPVDEKLDDVKSDVADVKTAVENIDFSALAKDETVAKEEQATLNKNELKQEMRNVAGPCVIEDYKEEGLPFEAVNGFCAILGDNDFVFGDFLPYGVHADDYVVGTVIKVTGDNATQEDFDYYEEGSKMAVAETVDTPSTVAHEETGLYCDSEGHMHGILSYIEWKKGGVYRVTGIVECYSEYDQGLISVITYEEVTNTVTDLVKQAAERASKSADHLAQFFGLPEALPSGYEFMTDIEVTDELEDIMQALDPELEQEVEYPEGSGTYMTKAQAITAEAMQIINPSQS